MSRYKYNALTYYLKVMYICNLTLSARGLTLDVRIWCQNLTSIDVYRRQAVQICDEIKAITGLGMASSKHCKAHNWTRVFVTLEVIYKKGRSAGVMTGGGSRWSPPGQQWSVLGRSQGGYDVQWKILPWGWRGGGGVAWWHIPGGLLLGFICVIHLAK